MRRRDVLAALPLGLLGLAACGPEESGPETPTAPPPVEHTEPVQVGERADVVEHTELRLPLEMTPMIVVDPGWTAVPLQLDGIFLGYREEEAHLRFLAVDQDGTVLWRADRPLSCTGFVLTRGPQGAPVAVLADLAEATGDELPATTLTGYDLRTAEPLWGPVGALGPQAAPGLVHAAPTDQPMGEGGPRTALSGATGEPLLREEDLAGGRILGEHLGTVVHLAGSELRASGADGEELWSIPLPAGIEPSRARLLGDIDPTTSFAVVTDQDSHGAVVDLADGRVIARDANVVARDHVLETTVVVSGTTVRGLEDDGTEKWTHEDSEPLQLLSAGERLAYAVRPEEGTLVVLDTNRGVMVQPYDVDQEGPLAVPQRFSADSAAAVRVQERHFLVTTEFDEEYGLRG
ncbi:MULTISPECIES: PQQ-binding-like beta-propeller repeat protein [Brachybacterium]|uniref:Pyrrolo-quinoline quinone repeat domain-containing protein n=2 Tax=Brachybacterium TaxID=43668 RepID=A0A3R8QWQ9_9MICO|nr:MULTISPECIES: PQQ-binding-like beta-propeller repeat protein [Brachybacterium]RRR20503.1 hypothetical protein DS079_03710 [Brachybacterium paraconglomeratum]GLI32406.1 hypothetical protein BCONGLO52_32470 [Brachybacterium conglomeratum]GLK03939.1 hypothetical protein GCM10017597_07380 [Brachybacterium conglomeratum]